MSRVVKLMEPFEQLSGKVCGHSKFIINLGKKGVLKDNMWTGKQCNPRDLSERPYTADETKVQERFKDVRLAIKVIKTNPTTLAQKYTAYASVRDNYKSFDSYLWKTQILAWDAEHSQIEEQEPMP